MANLTTTVMTVDNYDSRSLPFSELEEMMLMDCNAKAAREHVLEVVDLINPTNLASLCLTLDELADPTNHLYKDISMACENCGTPVSIESVSIEYWTQGNKDGRFLCPDCDGILSDEEAIEEAIWAAGGVDIAN